MSSIRLFLTISIISTIILANFLAALHGYQESMQQAEILFDHKLEKFAEFLANNTYDRKVTDKQPPMHSFSQHDETIIFQVRDLKDNILSQSEHFNQPLDFELKESLDYVNFAQARWRSVVHFYQQPQRWVLVMEKQDVRYKLAESVILKSVYPIILAIPTIAIIIFLIIQRGLLPIDKLAKQVTQKDAKDLTPITLDGVPEELNRLTGKINKLLQRLDHSLLREQRFASDAAHELRTPIAALKIQMKNLLDELVSKDEKSMENVQQLSQGVDRMGYLVEQILVLNRTLPQYFEQKFEWLDLGSILQEIVVELYPNIEKRAHEIELKISTANSIESDLEDSEQKNKVQLFADPFGIKILFKNLIGNAIKYTPSNGNIVIQMTRQSSSTIVSIMDSGPGIARESRQRIFERFYRLDGINDRKNSVIGCGLGLSIVKQIADLHQAKITLANSNFETASGKKIEKGLCVSISFEFLEPSKVV